tara:strand:- start:2299 stop:4764 length:2466 start_codon:yes stop_codon:yes gene_type:complete
MQKSARAMQKTGKSLTKNLTAPILAMGALSVKVFSSFQLEMAKVKAISGATADEFMRLEKNAQDLGASTIFSAKQVAALQVEFAKLGFTASEITKVTEATLALAQASGSDLSRAAEVAGSTLRAYGLDASETGRVTDVMAKSFSTSALDMEKFAESMKFVAPVAKSAGMSIEETSAMLAVMANSGIKGSQAGTALRRIISELGAGTKPTTEAIKDMAKAGIGLADAKDEVGRHAQSALLILASGADQIKPLTEEYENSAGAAKAMAAIMDDTVSGSMMALKSASEGAMIQIGELVSVAFRPLVQAITKVVQGFNNLDPGIKRFIVGAALAAATLGPMILLVGKLRMAFAALKLTMAATNPILFAISAAVVLIGGMMMSNTDALSDNTTAMLNNQSEANLLLDTLKRSNLTQETRNRLTDEYNTKFGTYAGNLTTEKSSLQDILDIQNALNDAFRDKIALLAVEEELADVLADAAAASIDTRQAQKEITALENEYNALAATISGLEDAGDYAGAVGLRAAKIDIRSSINEIESDIVGYTAVIDAATVANAALNSEMQAMLKPVVPVVPVAGGGDDPMSGMITGLETKGLGALDSFVDKVNAARASLGLSVPVVAELGVVLRSLGVAYDASANRALAFKLTVMDAMVEVESVINSSINKMVSGLAEMAGAMVMGEASAKDMKMFVLSTFADMLQQLGQIAINIGLGIYAVKKSLTDLNWQVAIGAGVALLAMAGMAKAQVGKMGNDMGGVPAMAEGGIVTGPTLALIGEGRGPEAVIPLDKLNGFLNGSGGNQNVVVTGRLSGSDLLISNERASGQRSRYRGF